MKLIGVIFCCLISLVCHSQPRGYQYLYDASGNRTTRTYTIFKAKSDSTENSNSEMLNTPNDSLSNYLEVRVYPNPAKDKLHLSFIKEDDAKSYFIKLYDLSGKLLFSKSGNVHYCEIDISTYSKGVYILEFIMDDIHERFKIIKK
ncbi:MAG: T9SS type A sorting domain-containing protein [Bacteroidales bacterium]